MSETDTRGKIIEAMYELVAQIGYERASIGHISEAIGIKKASVYYYFKSKEDIFLCLARGLYTTEYKADNSLYDETDGNKYVEKIICLGEKFIDSYFANKNARKVYAEIDIQSARIPALQKIVSQSDDEFKEFLMSCLRHGEEIGAFGRGVDVSLGSQILYTVLVGIDQIILYDLSVEPKAVWREVVEKVFR